MSFVRENKFLCIVFNLKHVLFLITSQNRKRISIVTFVKTDATITVRVPTTRYTQRETVLVQVPLLLEIHFKRVVIREMLLSRNDRPPSLEHVSVIETKDYRSPCSIAFASS